MPKYTSVEYEHTSVKKKYTSVSFTDTSADYIRTAVSYTRTSVSYTRTSVSYTRTSACIFNRKKEVLDSKKKNTHLIGLFFKKKYKFLMFNFIQVKKKNSFGKKKLESFLSIESLTNKFFVSLQ